MTAVGGELFTDYLITLRKLVTLNPKLKSTGAGRYQLLSRWWDAHRKQLGSRLLSEKVIVTLCILQQIKERGALPMIDRGDNRQAIDRCSNIWASLPGAGYGQFEHKADSLIAKSVSAGMCLIPRRVDTAIIPALVIRHHRPPVMGC